MKVSNGFLVVLLAVLVSFYGSFPVCLKILCTLSSMSANSLIRRQFLWKVFGRLQKDFRFIFFEKSEAVLAQW